MNETVTLMIGLDAPEVEELTARLPGPVVASEMLPRVRLADGQLLHDGRYGAVRPVGRVVYHGIFEFDRDLSFLNLLALWGGPCLPNPVGMIAARPRVTNLAVARRASRFGSLPRTYLPAGGTVTVDRPTVAKWGEWHCGEGKERFTGERAFDEPTLLEPFVPGEAVRVQVVGESAWQIRLGGDDWKKSIHHPTAGVTPADPELVTDVRRVMAAFGVELGASDFVLAADGTPHLLEFNHIPNVTQFHEVRVAYLDYVVRWAADR